MVIFGALFDAARIVRGGGRGREGGREGGSAYMLCLYAIALGASSLSTIATVNVCGAAMGPTCLPNVFNLGKNCAHD